MTKERKSCAFNPGYISPRQGVISGFEHPFDRELDSSNRWIASFTRDKPFDTSLFVDIRKRLGMDCINAINEKIVQLKTSFEHKSDRKNEPSVEVSQPAEDLPVDLQDDVLEPPWEEIHKGRLLLDATVCPQDIAYPTDLDLLSRSAVRKQLVIITYSLFVNS